jgi:hypothetical protein
MTDVTRWRFDASGIYDYTFARNPDRAGGDTFWTREPRMTENEVIGSNTPNIQVDGFSGAKRTIRFTAITGSMTRVLQNFYLRTALIQNCSDHLYPTTSKFSCFISGFASAIHPTTGSCPGSGEDTYDVEMVLIKMG